MKTVKYTAFLLVLPVAFEAMAQLYHSVREEPFEYVCEHLDGTVVSNHRRQDTAQDSCAAEMWRAMVAGEEIPTMRIRPSPLTMVPSAQAQTFAVSRGTTFSAITGDAELGVMTDAHVTVIIDEETTAEVPSDLNRIYADSDEAFAPGDIPDGFERVRMLHTLVSDQGSMGDTEVYSVTLDGYENICVWHSTAIESKPDWLITGYGISGHTITILGQTHQAYCQTKPPGALSLGGNTTDGATNGNMYVVTFQRSSRPVVAAPPVIPPSEIALTAPTGLTTTPGEDQVTVGWLAVHGADNYVVYADETEVDTVSATPESPWSYTTTAIGGTDGDQSLTQEGADWLMSFGGTSFDVAGGAGGDNILFHHATFTGDFDVDYCVDDFVTSEAFTHGGVNIRSSTGATATNIALYRQVNGRLHLRLRTTTDGAMPTSVNVANDNICQRLNRTGDVFTVYDRATTTSGWTQQGQETFAIGSTVEVGPFFAANTTTSSTASARIASWNLTQLAPVSYVHSTMTQNSYEVEAEDDMVPGPKSLPIVGGPSGGGGGGGGTMKWNPGVYIRAQSASTTFTASDHFSVIDEISEMPNVQGYKVHVYWGNLESTQDTYTFTQLQALYDYLEARNLRLILQIQTKRFSGTNCDKVVPDYLQATGTAVNTGQTACTAKRWDSAVMDRYIALVQALAGDFESATHFENVVFSETAVAAPFPSGDNYSPAAFLTQLKRAVDAALIAFPTTNKTLFFNFLSQANNDQAFELYEYLYDNEVLVGGPDVFPPGPGAAEGDTKTDTWGMRIRRNEWPVGDFDFRWNAMDELLHGANLDIQPPEMGGNEGNFTPAELIDHAYNTNAVTHLTIQRKTWQAAPTTSEPDCANWGPVDGSFAECQIGFKEFINQGLAIPPAKNAMCPANYAGGCQ